LDKIRIQNFTFGKILDASRRGEDGKLKLKCWNNTNNEL
jgi:hypothetical protein